MYLDMIQIIQGMKTKIQIQAIFDHFSKLYSFYQIANVKTYYPPIDHTKLYFDKSIALQQTIKWPATYHKHKLP